MPRIYLFGLAAMMIAALFGSPGAQAEEGMSLRLGALAPRGTAWHRKLLEIGEQW